MNKTDLLSINAIRVLTGEAVQKANSGHPGLPMGTAPLAYTLWAKHMKHNPKNSQWINRDRFILSAGHGSMLVYSLLHLFGYDVSIDDLKQFRQLGSKTPGHPELGHTHGVETTTGPLGQGFANGVGMAMAQAHMGAKFNKPRYEIFDHFTYVLSGDGCMMEGITSEAASLAGTLKLGRLVVFYDSNKISIEGDTDIAFVEDTGKRFEAYNWQVIRVDDGNDTAAISAAIEEAKGELSKPSLIIVKTEIGYGCPNKQGKASAHGEPLGLDNLKQTKEFLGWNTEIDFYVPDEVKNNIASHINRGVELENQWKALMDKYKGEYPDLASELDIWYEKDLNLDKIFDDSLFNIRKKAATRNLSSEVLNIVEKHIPNLIGGSADLSPSTKTIMGSRESFSPDNYGGSNLHFGVREHAMGAIVNGMSLHGGLRPYAATFFVFTDYMKGAMRLSSLMNLPVIYVLTHDSIGVGEDGPTHQPVEHLAALRSIPNMTVLRPADMPETVAAWYLALSNKTGPSALVFTRQNLPPLENTGKGALKGAYVVLDSDGQQPDIILIGTGSELSLACEAALKLEEKGIKARVVSMLSQEIFEMQSLEYKESVLPKDVRQRIAIEAGASMGWHKYTGLDGDVIAIDEFGVSGPYEQLMDKYGFTVENLVKRAESLLK